ncbi:hypothetical protein [Nocardia sp. SSK8]|uniref:hypothetical protein n=1 Tax=Nocardia sp. SSK8 TaxID=3120154 RepID=UPI00300B5606
MTPDDLDELFCLLIVHIDQLDSGALDLMAEAYDHAGDVDTARGLWELADRRRDGGSL